MENKKHIIATLIISFILITIFSIIILIYYIIIDCSFDISVLGIGEYLSFYNTDLQFGMFVLWSSIINNFI